MLKKTRKSNNIKVVATGSYVPEKIVTNHDLEKIVETTDEWISSRTGIKARRYVEEENALDLAYRASLKAINKVNYDINKIDLIIVATITAPNKTPSLANLLQGKLGLDNIMSFDINAACSGFIYALEIASKLLNSGSFNAALVVGAETLSKITNFEDRSTAVLFGDGAGAMIIENTDEDKPAHFYSGASADNELSLTVNDHIAMDGKKVYQFAVKIIPESIQEVLTDANLGIDQINKIIPHQANIRIIETAAKLLESNMDKFFINIDKYGNTSAASVIIALDEYINSLEDCNDVKVLLVAFGGGFTWAATILTL
jgi:3-oxoacyl-[acyl-carrier-protein] synthase-3